MSSETASEKSTAAENGLVNGPILTPPHATVTEDKPEDTTEGPTVVKKDVSPVPQARAPDIPDGGFRAWSTLAGA